MWGFCETGLDDWNGLFFGGDVLLWLQQGNLGKTPDY